MTKPILAWRIKSPRENFLHPQALQYLFDAIDERSRLIEDYLDGVDFFLDSGIPTLVPLTEGVNLKIDSEHVANMDRYVLAIVNSVLESQALTANTGFIVSQDTEFTSRGKQVDLNFASEVQVAIQAVKESLQIGEKGAKVALVVVGTGVAVVGIVSTGPLAGVAAAGGIALAGGVIIHEFANANAIAEFVNNPSEAFSRRAREARGMLKDVALALCGAINVPCAVLGFGKGVKDLGQAWEDLKCSLNADYCANESVSSCPVGRSLSFNQVGLVNRITPRSICLIPTSSDLDSGDDTPPSSPEPQPDPTTEINPCHLDSGVEADAYWLWYQRLYGGGGFSTYEHGGLICFSYYTNYYYEYMAGSLQGFDCDSEWENCELDSDGNYPFSSIESGPDGSRSYFYDDGNSWATRWPVE